MAPENVYRRGARDVHHAFRFAGKVFEHDSCRLDGKGNAWLPAPPPGPRCEACFGAAWSDRYPSRRLRNATLAGSAAVAGLVAVAFAASLDSPVNILPIPTASGSVPPLVSVTPGPTVAPPSPSLVPALTPVPVGTLPPLATYPPVPTFGPLPTWPPLPTFKLPTLPPVKPCIHPGTHLGVDPCKWPHQP